jgi:tRNA modification GTPase
MSAAAQAEATYLAWLTPPGAGAIATLALRGPQAWALVRQLFQPHSGRTLPEVPPDGEAGRFWLGWLGEHGRGESDEVVLAVKRGGSLPWVEVHCHGGRQVALMLEEVFTSRGAQVCSWQELERRTGEVPGKAEALAALAMAPTVRTAAILLDQYHGAFARAVAEVCACLQQQDREKARVLLDELARFIPVGQHLTDPWRVAILGAPNVGKSSLANRLAGYQRSVVSPIPGTTRDVVTTLLAVDGWPLELVDTAGWREGAEALEKQGIDLARAAAAGADLCLWVLDAAASPQWPAGELPGLHYVVNKIDLPPAWDVGTAAGAVRVSALTGDGLPELLEVLSGWLVPDPPPAGAAVPYTARLCERVEEARRCFAASGEAALAILRELQELLEQR